MTTRTSVVCRASDRRAIVKRKNVEAGSGTWNGIDYVEFNGQPGMDRLLVYLLCPIPAESAQRKQAFQGLLPSHFLLWDEVTRRSIKIVDISRLTGTSARLKAEEPLCPGRCYRLTLRYPSKVDPQFANYGFTATAETTEVDPEPQPDSPPPTPTEPQPNYLARDYASFRQLLLDRLALIMPEWKERHVPDLGLTLVEAFAYVGDYLSYYQDAVATEAYLHTARQRISVRRHARLVDYQLHEGCNARTFVHLEVDGDLTLDPQDAFFITAHPDAKYAGRPALAASTLERVPENSFQPFEIVCTQAKRSALEPQDIKNVLGLVYCLIANASSDSNSITACVARFIWSRLPIEMQKQLQICIENGQGSLCAKLEEGVIKELVKIVREFRLRDEIRYGCAANPELPHVPSKPVGCSATNLSILGAALEGHVARSPNERQAFYRAHNEIAIYTWSGRQCCLPKGTTRATLKDGDPTCMPQSVSPNGQTSNSNELPCGQRPNVAQVEIWELRNLQCGDLLVFEEVRGPKTQLPADANPAHRQVVRLTKVNCTIDPLTCQQIIEIEWDEKDALHFSLCISSVGPVDLGCQLNEQISIARGNVVLVDHGLRTDEPQWLGEVHYQPASATCDQDDALPSVPQEPDRAELLRPVLQSDLTFAAPIKCSNTAAELLAQKPHDGSPAIRVFGFPMATEAVDSARDADVPPPTLINLDDVHDPLNLLLRFNSFALDEQRRLEAMLPPAEARFLQETRAKVRRDQLHALQLSQASSCLDNACQPKPPLESALLELDERRQSFAKALRAAVLWQPKAHLMQSQPAEQHFVVEVDNERRSHLRFGDNDQGRLPPAEMSFYANYRRGNGTAGNVGAEKIVHLVYRHEQVGGIRAVRNVLPAIGGRDAETLDHARLIAPRQYLKPRRAITADDYATIARREFANQVQQARANLSWMGTWYEAAVAIDPFSAVRDAELLRRNVETTLEKYRRIGHLLRVSLPIYVGLDIAMTVCVKPGYLRAHVRQELLDLFGSGVRSDGTKGFFSPDTFTFGDSLYLSRLVSAAKQVAGVENMLVTRFERYGHSDVVALQAGVLDFAPLEIPRLDNDPLHPEFGRFCLEMRGER
jgi:predicted phage baseplate assembly protein